MINDRAVLNLFKVARGVLPAAVRARVSRWMFECLDQRWTLPFGVFVRINSYRDWVIYNEIFVRG